MCYVLVVVWQQRTYKFSGAQTLRRFGQAPDCEDEIQRFCFLLTVKSLVEEYNTNIACSIILKQWGVMHSKQNYNMHRH